MNTHSCDLLGIKIPKIEVADVNQSSLWENTTYIPILSNTKGTVDIFIGTAQLICTVVATVFILFVLVPMGICKDLHKGHPIFGPMPGPNQMWAPVSHSTFFATTAHNLLVEVGGDSITTIARGVLESVPIAGNLALGFWDGKIKIIHK